MRSGHENCGFSVRIARTGTYPDHVIARFMGPTWAHLGLTGPRWAPCWPHELCYLGMPPFIFISTNRSKLKFPSSLLRGSLTCIKGPGRSRWSVLENGDEFRMIVILCIPYHVMIWKIISTHWSLEKYFYIHIWLYSTKSSWIYRWCFVAILVYGSIQPWGSERSRKMSPARLNSAGFSEITVIKIP